MPTETAANAVPKAVQGIVTAPSPKAASLIVTIYGDVVEPRGGTLWMGTLIECCAMHGISESLVRTAVSRLVGAGRLVGERVGRKSFYRLSLAGQAEFRQASRILFPPPAPPEEWLVGFANKEEPPPGWVRIGPQAILAPHREGMGMPCGTVMRVQSLTVRDLPEFAAQYWPLDAVAKNYRGFIARFAPVRDVARLDALSGQNALTLRLRLVDEYRHAVLADPRLPVEALPGDWPAQEARDIFRQIYLSLSPAADRFVGRSFAASDGLLPEMTEETMKRSTDLLRD
ncbi:PaaX family transcriptional regulator [Paracoccus onubensis]|uniref:ArsR family transcriptional regulator n=1 Tax=Paracoccus onubensis TaxID=1675788 RepID=A0A418T2B7_9RHOB|nr:PaaX family transcriptional regulator C-terminal domain-containing protein [Paracoccus onubensis]RJE87362.1 ArsR family transcriptional regulator [Paracoccus onubensis]